MLPTVISFNCLLGFSRVCEPGFIRVLRCFPLLVFVFYSRLVGRLIDCAFTPHKAGFEYTSEHEVFLLFCAQCDQLYSERRKTDDGAGTGTMLCLRTLQT